MGNGGSKYYHKWFAGIRNQKHIWWYSGLTDWVNYPCMTNGIEKDKSLWKKEVQQGVGGHPNGSRDENELLERRAYRAALPIFV